MSRLIGCLLVIGRAQVALTRRNYPNPLVTVGRKALMPSNKGVASVRQRTENLTCLTQDHDEWGATFHTNMRGEGYSLLSSQLRSVADRLDHGCDDFTAGC
jgi:hypothetical protein